MIKYAQKLTQNWVFPLFWEILSFIFSGEVLKQIDIVIYFTVQIS